MKVVVASILLAAVFVAGCPTSDTPDSGIERGPFQSAFGVRPVPNDPPPPSPPSPSALLAVASSNRSMAAVNSSVEFTAAISGGVPPYTVEWTSSEGATALGTAVQFAFSAADIQFAAVRIRSSDGQEANLSASVVVVDTGSGSAFAPGDVDGNGQLQLRDALIAAQAILALRPIEDRASQLAADLGKDGSPGIDEVHAITDSFLADLASARFIRPAEGRPGRFVMLAAPALLNPDSSVSVMMLGKVVPFFRSAIGYASFMIPLDVAGSDPTQIAAQTMPIQILVDGVMVDSFDFDLEPAPALSAAPGETANEFIQISKEILPHLEQRLRDYLPTVTADIREQDVVVGLHRAALGQLIIALDEINDGLNTTSGDSLRDVSLVAESNGILDGLAAVRASRLRLIGSPGALAGDELLPYICNYSDVASTVLDYAGTLRSALCIVSTGGCAAGAFTSPTGVGAALAAVSCSVAAITCLSPALDIAQVVLEVVLELVPRPLQELKVDVRPDSATQGQSHVDVFLKVDYSQGLCAGPSAGGSSALVNKVTEKIAQRLVRRYTNRLPQSLRDRIGRFLEPALSAIIGEALDMAGISGLIEQLQQRFCQGVASGGVVELPFATNRLSSMRLEGSNPGTIQPSESSATHNCAADDPSSARVITELQLSCGQDDQRLASGRADLPCGAPVNFMFGDNGSLLDDIFELIVDGQSVQTSSTPVRRLEASRVLTDGEHLVSLRGRAAPDGVGTYFLSISGATVIAGPPLSGSNLSAGLTFTWTIRVGNAP